jgi:predicted amidohydrolase
MPKTKASPHRVAVVQHPSFALHRERTLMRGGELMAEAAAGGARLIAFPETCVPGYPEWLWRLRSGDDYELTGEIHARLLENAVDLPVRRLRTGSGFVSQENTRRYRPLRPARHLSPRSGPRAANANRV